MSPGVFLVYCVGRNLVLCVYILALKVGPCLFHSPTSVLSQCTISLPSLWLPCIYLLVMLSGVSHSLSPDIYSKIIEYQGEVHWSTVAFP